MQKPDRLMAGRRRKAWAQGLAVILAAACLASCTAAVDVDPALEAELLDIVEPAPELAVAQQYAQAVCLREAGFDVPIDLTIPALLGSENLAGIVGLFPSVEVAERVGYTSSLVAAAVDPAGEYLASLSDADSDALQFATFGDESHTASYAFPGGGGQATTTTGGCFGSSVIQVFGSPEEYLQLSTVRSVLSSKANLSSSEPAGAGDYRACMERAGFPSSGVNETMAIAAERFGGSRGAGSSPGEEERRLARADASCQLEAGFLQEYNDQFLTSAGAWLVKNESWIVGTNELKRKALENAKGVLEAAG